MQKLHNFAYVAIAPCGDERQDGLAYLTSDASDANVISDPLSMPIGTWFLFRFSDDRTLLDLKTALEDEAGAIFLLFRGDADLQSLALANFPTGSRSNGKEHESLEDHVPFIDCAEIGVDATVDMCLSRSFTNFLNPVPDAHEYIAGWEADNGKTEYSIYRSGGGDYYVRRGRFVVQPNHDEKGIMRYLAHALQNANWKTAARTSEV